MNSIAHQPLALKNFSPRFLKAASFAVAACVLATAQLDCPLKFTSMLTDLPHAPSKNLRERPSRAIMRWHGVIWQGALESDRAEEFGEEFVGFAKDRLDAENRRTKSGGCARSDR